MFGSVTVTLSSAIACARSQRMTTWARPRKRPLLGNLGVDIDRRKVAESGLIVHGSSFNPFKLIAPNGGGVATPIF